MVRVITIGSATLDVYLKSGAFKEIKSEKFLTGIGECLALGSKNEVQEVFVDTGGGATNCAATFANLGIKVSAMTRIGNDLFGGEVERVLKSRKIGTDLLQKDKKLQTSYSTLLLLGTGQRSILVYRGASNALDFLPKSQKPDWFYITSLGGNTKLLGKILSYAKKNKIKAMYNPGGGELRQGLFKLKKYFRGLEVLNLNREEASELCNTKYENMNIMIKKLNGLAPYVVITDGPSGAFCLHNKELWFAPSLGTKPINTTGAGDAFGSGFCAGLMLSAQGGSASGRKNNLDYALRLGILNSDGVIKKMGAKNGLLEKLPGKKQLDKVKIKQERIKK
ncbi:carbohydrate kinase family protein [Patescibacteria group bacterium]|nr:carbohydrate kinase family protein [Patescibacteria group bacterium]